jgi:hypothetical protein
VHSRQLRSSTSSSTSSSTADSSIWQQAHSTAPDRKQHLFLQPSRHLL